MRYVIDTSVDIKTYVQEQDSSKAVRLRNEYHQGVHQLIAPDIFPTEMCKVADDSGAFRKDQIRRCGPLLSAIPKRASGTLRGCPPSAAGA